MRLLSFLVLTVLLNPCFSQWTYDPEDPLVISDAPGIQRYLKALDDGSGGWYLFWRDSPTANGIGSIYGQHLDQDGYVLWEENGQFILDHPNGNVNSFDVETMSSGEILLLYTTAVGSGAPGDSLRAMLVGTDGSHSWGQSLLVGAREPGMLWFHNPRIEASGTGALIAYHPQVTGGGYQTRIDRIEMDGSLLVGVNGQQIVTTAFGPMDLLPDGNEGALIHWRNSNGAGTHMGVYRFDSQCVPLWAGIVDPVAGSAGLGWEYEAISDGQGGIAIVFDEVGNEIQFVRLDGDGNQVLTPAIKPVAPFSSSQSLPHLLLHDESFFVCWEDNRPPADNADLYMQRLDQNGDPEWDDEGVLVIQGNTYVPHAGMVPTDSGGVMAAQLMSFDGFVGQRMQSDGTGAWSEYGQFCTDMLVPFYGEFQLWPDGLGGMVAFWHNQENLDLYAAKMSFDGNSEPSGIAEWTTFNTFLIYPNPSSGIVRLDWKGDFEHITIADAYGKVIRSIDVIEEQESVMLDLTGISIGLYLVNLDGEDQLSSSKRLLIVDD